jgi:tripartite ATP-independent transporter DctM subunit
MFRVPVAFAMLVLSMVGIGYIVGLMPMLLTPAAIIYGIYANYLLVVIPLFIWMGFIAFHAGISRQLYDATYKLVGNVKGGLALATTMACAAFGAVCGSSTATAATFATMSLPEMKKRNYNRSFATGTVAAGGILGILIPPSVVYIVYAVVTGQDIRRLFAAGIPVGLLLMVLYIATIYLLVARHPEKAPAGAWFPWKERIKAVAAGGIEVIIIFGLMMGGLLAGYFTGTEAGSIGAFVTLVVMLARRTLNWQRFLNSLKDTIRTATMVMFLLATAGVYAEFLELTRLPAIVSDWVVGLPLPPFGIMIAIFLLLLVLGCFIDAMAKILMTLPFFYPVALEMGYDPIWFGIMMTLAAGMALLTPPVGANVYVVSAVDKETPLLEIFNGVWPYVGAGWVCLMLLLIFPEIATFLPDLMFGVAP